jgi:hypothetical protein
MLSNLLRVRVRQEMLAILHSDDACIRRILEKLDLFLCIGD